MKTKDNSYRIVKNTIAIVIVGLTLCFSSKGQKSFIEFSNDNYWTTLRCLLFEFDHITNNDNVFHARNYNFGKEKITPIEATMNLENWMINFGSWSIKSDSYICFMDVVEEDEFEVEDWMLHEFNILNPKQEQSAHEITMENNEEEKMVIEDWMLDSSHWTSKKLTQKTNEF